MIESKPKAKRIIAIDFGMVRIGLALSDERKVIASPWVTIIAEKRSEQTIAKLLKEFENHQKMYHYELEEIIVGMPLMMSGKSGLLADEVKNFVTHLQKATTIPIRTWDERLTTVQAEKALREGSMNRKQRTKVVDTVSAAILLQSYLDYKAIKLDTV